jgi:hypothetical protein
MILDLVTLAFVVIAILLGARRWSRFVLGQDVRRTRCAACGADGSRCVDFVCGVCGRDVREHGLMPPSAGERVRVANNLLYFLAGLALLMTLLAIVLLPRDVTRVEVIGTPFPIEVTMIRADGRTRVSAAATIGSSMATLDYDAQSGRYQAFVPRENAPPVVTSGDSIDEGVVQSWLEQVMPGLPVDERRKLGTQLFAAIESSISGGQSHAGARGALSVRYSSTSAGRQRAARCAATIVGMTILLAVIFHRTGRHPAEQTVGAAR